MLRAATREEALPHGQGPSQAPAVDGDCRRVRQGRPRWLGQAMGTDHNYTGHHYTGHDVVDSC